MASRSAPRRLKGAKQKLGIALEPFSVPDDVLKAWRAAGSRGAAARKEWETQFAAARQPQARRIRTPHGGMNGRLRSAKALKAHKKALAAETPQKIATRKSSELALEAIAPAVPE